MKALVGVKRVLDYAIKVRVNPEKTAVELKGLKMSMNPFCEIAVEEAIRLKEKGHVSEITALTIGDKGSAETLRTALAMGADKGIHILTDMRIDQELQPLAVAKIFQLVNEKYKYDLMLFGKQAIDDDANQTAQLVSALANMPLAAFASKIEVVKDGIEVTREIDQGLQKIFLSTPALISCDLRLNNPRIANIQSISKAKKKPVETIKIEDLLPDPKPRLKVLKVSSPSARQGGNILETVDDLVAHLQKDKVL